MKEYSSVIAGTGSYLPNNIVTNEDLSKTVDTSDEWITSRTGIKQRHIVSEGELTSDMATIAAKKAIDSAKIMANDIDMIIVCTTTPDSSFPSVAAKVQANLNIKDIPAFDLQAACSGFVYGLVVANNFIKAGGFKNILVIGADSMSKLMNWQDRNTCVLFGDGAGAAVIKSTDKKNHEGIISCKIHANGAYESILRTNGGVASTKTAGTVEMVGREVFKHAVEKMSQVITDLIDESEYEFSDINWIVPHQANARIIDAIAARLSFPKEKIAMTLDMQANTSAATIPLALDNHAKKGIIKSGDLIVLTALGAGLTWGGAILRWL